METGGPKLKQKVENKNKRLELARRQRADTLARVKQKKIDETWKLIPEHERRKLLAEEAKNRRMELREVKVNIWKKWRKSEKNTPTTEKVSKPLEDIWLGRLEETLARMKLEVEKRKSAKILD